MATYVEAKQTIPPVGEVAVWVTGRRQNGQQVDNLSSPDAVRIEAIVLQYDHDTTAPDGTSRRAYEVLGAIGMRRGHLTTPPVIGRFRPGTGSYLALPDGDAHFYNPADPHDSTSQALQNEGITILTQASPLNPAEIMITMRKVPYRQAP